MAELLLRNEYKQAVCEDELVMVHFIWKPNICEDVVYLWVWKTYIYMTFR